MKTITAPHIYSTPVKQIKNLNKTNKLNYQYQKNKSKKINMKNNLCKNRRKKIKIYLLK